MNLSSSSRVKPGSPKAFEGFPYWEQLAASREVENGFALQRAASAEEFRSLRVVSTYEEASVEYEFEMGHVVFRREEPARVHAPDKLPIYGAQPLGPSCHAGGIYGLGEKEGVGKFFNRELV